MLCQHWPFLALMGGGGEAGNYRDCKFTSIVYLKRLVYSLSPSDSVSFSSLANNSSQFPQDGRAPLTNQLTNLLTSCDWLALLW